MTISSSSVSSPEYSWQCETEMIDRVCFALGEGAQREREREREIQTDRQTGYEGSLEVISCYSENDCSEWANTSPLNLKLLLPSVESLSH